MRIVRGISGAVAAGLVLLAGVVIGAAVIGARRDFPGPGGQAIVWHLVVAGMALVAQVYADRRRRPATVLAAAAVVLGGAAFLLWTQWWG